MLLSIWFVLWGLLWAVYFMLDGFDLGLGMAAPFIAKNQREKNLIYHAIGPFWNGNEVWLITAGGVTFAAFPTAYAVLFSSFYSPLMLILFALIVRGVSLEFRDKSSNYTWQKLWEGALFLGSFIPSFLFGVAFANIFRGIPIDERGLFQGTVLDLLNFYGMLGGLLFTVIFLVHGLLWLAVRTEGELQKRALNQARFLWLPLIVVSSGFLLSTWYNTNLYVNYIEKPLFYAVPAVIVPLAVLGGLGSIFYFAKTGNPWKAWIASSVAIVGVTFFGVLGLYPNLLPSSLNAAYSLTIHNAASSPLTLKIMLAVVILLVPIVIAYQFMVYRTFSFPLKDDPSSGY